MRVFGNLCFLSSWKLRKAILVVFFSFFGVGFLPVGQGTVASFLVGSLYMLFYQKFVIEFCLLVVVLGFALVLAPKIRDIWKEKDPHQVVIDEVVGMMFSVFLLPKTFWVILLSFVVFRLFDISKVPPVSFFDRMDSPYGVILDDLVAGVMANLSVRILLLFFPQLM